MTSPGVYEIPDVEYHAHPALSSTGARKILPPSTPAHFRWWQTHPRDDTNEFDMGHAAHTLVLGSGPGVVEVPADSWRTTAAKDLGAAARAEGKVPLLTKDHATVHAMAAKLVEHDLAASLLLPEWGKPEQSLFWVDAATGVECRARLDWLPTKRSGRLIIPDYKTARSAHGEAFGKAMVDHGYHQQAPWYQDAVKALSLDDDPAFVFIVQEKTAPYLVNVIEPDPAAMRAGRMLNAQARELFAVCDASGRWPGYGDEVESVELPFWYARQFEEIL